MFARLRHYTIVGGDHEQGEVDAAGTGDHRVHEALVAGHVDEAEHVTGGQSAIDSRGFNGNIGVAELYRYAAGLFFLQAVGVHARQRSYQRGLAVVDVAGGTDDHMRSSLHCVTNAASSASSRQRRSSHNA